MLEAGFQHTAFSSQTSILFCQSWIRVLRIGDMQVEIGRPPTVNFIEEITVFAGREDRCTSNSGKISRFPIFVIIKKQNRKQPLTTATNAYTVIMNRCA